MLKILQYDNPEFEQNIVPVEESAANCGVGSLLIINYCICLFLGLSHSIWFRRRAIANGARMVKISTARPQGIFPDARCGC